eukprot:gene28564-35446_t
MVEGITAHVAESFLNQFFGGNFADTTVTNTQSPLIASTSPQKQSQPASGSSSKKEQQVQFTDHEADTGSPRDDKDDDEKSVEEGPQGGDSDEEEDGQTKGKKGPGSSKKSDAQNVYWNVGTSATLMADVTMVGTVMAQASVTAASTATTGPLMSADAAVTLINNI